MLGVEDTPSRVLADETIHRSLRKVRLQLSKRLACQLWKYVQIGLCIPKGPVESNSILASQVARLTRRKIGMKVRAKENLMRAGQHEVAREE